MKELNSFRERRRKKMSPDDYIRFVTFFNKFINHKRRKVKKITGNEFKI